MAYYDSFPRPRPILQMANYYSLYSPYLMAYFHSPFYTHSRIFNCPYYPPPIRPTPSAHPFGPPLRLSHVAHPFCSPFPIAHGPWSYLRLAVLPDDVEFGLIATWDTIANQARFRVPLCFQTSQFLCKRQTYFSLTALIRFWHFDLIIWKQHYPSDCWGISDLQLRISGREIHLKAFQQIISSVTRITKHYSWELFSAVALFDDSFVFNME